MADQVSDLSARVARMMGCVVHFPPSGYPVMMPSSPGPVVTMPMYASDLSACLRDVVPWLLKRGHEPQMFVTFNGPAVLVRDYEAPGWRDVAHRAADMREGPLDQLLARLLCECALQVGNE